MRAPVNKIIPFSSVDGPGNRTSIFFQECNFNCRYCHNPETRNMCVNCGDCVEKCPTNALSIVDGKVTFDYNRCVLCDTCIKTCTHGASPRIRNMTPEEVMEEVKKQVPFIRGITTSGGECTMNAPFLRELFSLAKENGLGALIDSNGSYDFEKDSEHLLEVCDGVMLDVKAWSEDDHRAVCDVDNEMVLKNLRYLASVGKLYEVRTVVVPGLFDVKETVEKVSKEIVKYLSVSDIRYKIITYRPMGVRKEYLDMAPPSKELIEELKQIALNEGVKTVVTV
ncbi:MAG: YjjW family glycine radical enzyme activase [Lachnospiraceae bacterium]|nr:YjjW family glycine radical enzyme activase [Lachnospiraceae bacterium]